MKRRSLPIVDDGDDIFQKHSVKLQPHGEAIVALLLEVGVDVPPDLAVAGGGRDMGGAAEASKETVDIFEGVVEAPQQGLEVFFDGEISGLATGFGNGVGQLA